jgi:sugar (pentulose or hexulose) kinase
MPLSSLLLGIDLGTSYFKVGLFDQAGRSVGLGRIAVDKVSRRAGYFELGTPDFWRLLRAALARALAEARATSGQIAAISYSSQANTFLLLDAADRPLTPLIFWTDERAADSTPPILADSAEFEQVTGFGELSAYSAVTKLRWLAHHEPHLWQDTRRILSLSDYFCWALTGEAVGDAGTASLLGLYDLAKEDWWDAGLKQAGIARSQLSRPLLPGTLAGKTARRAGEYLGIPGGIPFAVGSLDHHVAALGSGLPRFADVSIATGTVLAALTVVPAGERIAGCFHGPHVHRGQHFRLAFDPNGAGQLEIFQQQHAPGMDVGELLALAARQASVLTPEEVTLREATLAVLTKIARTQRRLVATVAGAKPVRRIVATGGGSRSELWLQIKADLIGAEIITPAQPERACLGAAAIAATACGLYATLEEALGAMVKPDRSFRPQAPSS